MFQVFSDIPYRDAFPIPEISPGSLEPPIEAGNRQQLQRFPSAFDVLVDQLVDDVAHFPVLQAGRSLEQVFLLFGDADGRGFQGTPHRSRLSAKALYVNRTPGSARPRIKDAEPVEIFSKKELEFSQLGGF